MSLASSPRCFSPAAHPYTATTGASLGGLSGALVGSFVGNDEYQSRNAILGGLIGAGVGYAAGNEMDKNDQSRLGHTLETGRSNQVVSWRNPDTGQQYKATPKPAYQDGGRTCREVDVETVIDGNTQVMEATACRQPDGSWQLVDGNASSGGTLAHNDDRRPRQPRP